MNKDTTIPTCTFCKQQHILIDAWAAWDAEEGNWTLISVQDQPYCISCMAECSITWEEPNEKTQD